MGTECWHFALLWVICSMGGRRQKEWKSGGSESNKRTQFCFCFVFLSHLASFFLSVCLFCLSLNCYNNSSKFRLSLTLFLLSISHFYIYYKLNQVSVLHCFRQIGDSVDALYQREDPVKKHTISPLHLSMSLFQGWVTHKHTCMGFPILVTQGISNLKPERVCVWLCGGWPGEASEKKRYSAQ